MSSTTGSAFQGFRSKSGASQAGDHKVKFTVSVHGHQWSSARHVHETLEEFARVIERNAKRLEFIAEADTIQRLQLVRPDGSEPEELDVDATLEDVLICMGDKQLVAIIPSFAASDSVATKDLHAPDEHHKPMPASFFIKTETPTSYMLTPTSAPLAENESPTPGCSTPGGYSSVRSLKFPSCEYSSAPVFSDVIDGSSKSLYGAQSGLNSFLNSSTATPTPAELAQFLVRGSSSSSTRPMTSGGGSSMFGHCGAAPAASPVPMFAAGCHQSPFVPSIGGRGFQGAASSPAGGGGAAPNIALLAQFLAAQLKAFTPAPENPVEASGKGTFVNQADATGAGTHHRARTSQRGAPQEARKLNGVQAGESQDEKDASSSSANINNPGFSSSFGAPDSSDPAKGRSELVFLVNRRSKMGVGTHHLKMSDLSSYFHLSIVDAAKKLGVSQTTLKKACRKFGLKRWPGRKVRSLESTIHGLEHTIAVGQGAGMEDLTEAYMRSEVLKLQQEMDQLVHGLPAAQHLPMVRTADLYKRLYSRGWRSKFHSPCNRLDIDLNMESREENKASGAQEFSWKNTQGTHTGSKDCAWKTTPQASDGEQQQEQQCNENYHQPIQEAEEVEVEEMTSEERSAKKPKVELDQQAS